MIARVVIGGTSSGAGKTTVATGLLAALAARGLRTAGFKVGPDFIDPSYHALASGRPGRNLDAFLSGPELIAPLFRHGSAGADIAVVEGVMGLYDGASGRGELASTAHVAKLLRAPVVLVVDAAALARSAAAIVHGYASYDPEVDVAGVILNRVGSEGHADLLREAIEPLGVPVLGVLHRDDALTAPERHLGLVPVAEREPRALRDARPARRGDRGELRPRRAAAPGARRARRPGRALAARSGRRAARAGADRDRPRAGLLVPLRGEPRAAARRGRRARRPRPADRRGAAAAHRRARARRRLPRGLRRGAVGQLGAARRDRRLRRARPAGPRRVRRAALPRARARRAPDVRRRADRRAHDAAPEPRLPRGDRRRRPSRVARGRDGPRPRVPLLARRAGRRRARPRVDAARPRARARRGPRRAAPSTPATCTRTGRRRRPSPRGSSRRPPPGCAPPSRRRSHDRGHPRRRRRRPRRPRAPHAQGPARAPGGRSRLRPRDRARAAGSRGAPR